MATLETDEANIVDVEAVNWRLIVYPVLIVLIVGFGALGYYYYQQSQREIAESNARAALIKATTPDELLKVAAQFPDTDQAALAILQAADDSFGKRDFAAALDAYNKILADSGLNTKWHDTAELGLASCDEAMNTADKALAAYTEVMQRGDKSPYAPYAALCAARIYDQRGDTNNERQILQQAASLDPDSYFTREAQEKLKQMSTPATPPLPVAVPPATDAQPPAPAPAAANPAPVAPAQPQK